MAKPLMMKIMNDTEKCHMRCSRILGTAEYVSMLNWQRKWKARQRQLALFAKAWRSRLSGAGWGFPSPRSSMRNSATTEYSLYLFVFFSIFCPFFYLASLWCFLLPITRQFGFATLQCNPLHHLGRDNVFAFWSFLSQMPAPGRGRWILQQASTDPAGRSVWASLSTEDCKGSIKCVMQCMQQNNRVKMMKGVQKPQSDERYTFFSANVIHKCRIFLCHVHCQRVNNTDAQIPFSFVGAS